VPYIHHRRNEDQADPALGQELRRIQPHALICRSVTGLDRDIRQKIAHFASLPIDAVISGQDVDNVFKILLMCAEGLDDFILDHFRVEAPAPDLADWKRCSAWPTVPPEPSASRWSEYIQLADSQVGHGGPSTAASTTVKVQCTWST
jgi:CTP synthase